MDIAVIIPLFNGSKWIRSTLKSVFSQSHLPKEVIVIDDGSTDQSVEIVQSFTKVKLLHNPNKGSHFARLLGFNQTTAPLVTFLDQDDIWHPDHLHLLHQSLEKFPQSHAAVANYSQFYQERRLVFPSPCLNPHLFDPWQSFPTNSIATPSAVLIRRSALENIGGWFTQFVGAGCVDVYTWLRLSVEQPLIKNHCVTVGYRRHPNSLGISLRLQNIQRLMDANQRILEDALAYRLAVHPEESNVLSNRLNLLTPLANIVKAATTYDLSLLNTSALSLEENLASESSSFVQSISNLLLWFLYPYVDTQYKTLIFLLEHWPLQAARTRQCFLVRIASSRILPKHLLFHPLNPHLWKLLPMTKAMLLNRFNTLGVFAPKR